MNTQAPQHPGSDSASDSGSDSAAGPGRSAAWRVMWGYARPFRYWLLLGGVLSLATSASGLALPLVVRLLIERLSSGDGVTGVLVVMSVLVVANAAIGAAGGFVLERAGESVVLSARRGLIDRLTRLRLSAVERTEPGDLMSRVTADTTLLREITTGSLVNAVTGVLTLAATLVMMAVLDIVLLAVTLLVIVGAGLVIGVLVPRINRAAKAAQEAVGVMGAALERMFGAFRTVKASGAEQREAERVHAAAHDAWRAGVRGAWWGSVAGNTAGLAVQLAVIIVLALGGARVAGGAIGVGTLIAFLLYLYYLMPPIGQLVSAVTQYQVGAAAVERIQQAQAMAVEPGPPAAAPAATPVAAPVAAPAVAAGRGERPGDGPGDGRPVGAGAIRRGEPVSVTFESVTFRYRDDVAPVHHEVSFDIPPRGMTAFVGPSGAGKTTVFSLIERFYEIESGRVLVDGVDVRDWPLDRLRAAIGYVEQDAPVLSGTLAENLRFATPDAADGDLHQALRVTRLAELVARLPQGLETTVGHRGMTLSGGERQRVAIARALLRRPRLLLLDEATSALDAVNEAALRETVAEVARDTTVLVVAHRLSTVTLADRIVVLDAGRVQAVGTHAQLLDTNPLYAELAATQFLTAVAG